MATTKKKNNRAPKARHGWWLAIFFAGCLLPPLAVLMRFGVGRDFFINILFTLCGYFPGHGHNFYLQNIRNNTGRGRTPKWAIKHGLVKDESAEAKGKRDWVHRYNERLPANAYDENGGFHDEFGNPVANGHGPSQPRRRTQDSTLLPTEEGQGERDLPQSPRALERFDSRDSTSTRSNLGRKDDISDLPGAGDRKAKAVKKGGLKGLLGVSKSSNSNDRFARMEAERERVNGGPTYSSGADDLGGIDWLDEGRSNQRKNGLAGPLGVSKSQPVEEQAWRSTDDLPNHEF